MDFEEKKNNIAVKVYIYICIAEVKSNLGLRNIFIFQLWQLLNISSNKIRIYVIKIEGSGTHTKFFVFIVQHFKKKRIFFYLIMSASNPFLNSLCIIWNSLSWIIQQIIYQLYNVQLSKSLCHSGDIKIIVQIGIENYW